jgi:hypothetical protein
MTHVNTQRQRWLVLLAGIVVAGAVAAWLATASHAITDGMRAPLDPVEMTEGQTLRISVAYVRGFDPQPDPPGCQLEISFVDADNRAYGGPDMFELRPGDTRSFDYVAVGNPHIREVGDPTIRQYVQPVVVDLDPAAGCPAVVSGELLDRDGINGIIVYDSVALH